MQHFKCYKLKIQTVLSEGKSKRSGLTGMEVSAQIRPRRFPEAVKESLISSAPAAQVDQGPGERRFIKG